MALVSRIVTQFDKRMEAYRRFLQNGRKRFCADCMESARCAPLPATIDTLCCRAGLKSVTLKSGTADYGAVTPFCPLISIVDI